VRAGPTCVALAASHNVSLAWQSSAFALRDGACTL
jgi:hypothetical protein